MSENKDFFIALESIFSTKVVLYYSVKREIVKRAEEIFSVAPPALLFSAGARLIKFLNNASVQQRFPKRVFPALSPFRTIYRGKANKRITPSNHQS